VNSGLRHYIRSKRRRVDFYLIHWILCVVCCCVLLNQLIVSCTNLTISKYSFIHAYYVRSKYHLIFTLVIFWYNIHTRTLQHNMLIAMATRLLKDKSNIYDNIYFNELNEIKIISFKQLFLLYEIYVNSIKCTNII